MDLVILFQLSGPFKFNKLAQNADTKYIMLCILSINRIVEKTS